MSKVGENRPSGWSPPPPEELIKYHAAESKCLLPARCLDYAELY